MPERISPSVNGPITHADLLSYLKRKGWRVRIFNQGQFVAYDHERAPDQEILVPLDRAYTDYSRRIQDALSILEDVEGRKSALIIAEMHLTSNSDLLKFRIANHSTSEGQIPLKLGISLFSGAKKALIASACSVVNPQPYYTQVHYKRKEIEDFLSACLIAQTEKGSFVANFLCPINAIPSQGTIMQSELFDPNQTESFTRKVTKNLLKSLSELKVKLDSGDLEGLINPTPNSSLVSANLCDAILEMETDDGASTVEIISVWSKLEPIEDGFIESVSIPKAHFPLIKVVSEALKPKVQPNIATYVGNIVTLSGAPDQDGKMQGSVTFATIFDEKLIKAKLQLDPDDYQFACDAHKTRMLITVTGELIQVGRSYKIDGVENFKPLNP